MRRSIRQIGLWPPEAKTRSLLGWGVVAGPFYVLVALGQALLRQGFDLTRHDVSLLANGDWGWIQTTNFLLTGAMVVAGAIGIGRALAGGPGGTWGPRFLAAYGLGLIGAGLFAADPMNGFPSGTPDGRPEAVSAHGILHLIFAAIGFLCLVAACWLLARRWAAEGRSGRMSWSIATGLVFLIAFIGLASGSSSSPVVLGFWAALLLAWVWIAGTSVLLYRRVGAAFGARRRAPAITSASS